MEDLYVVVDAKSGNVLYSSTDVDVAANYIAKNGQDFVLTIKRYRCVDAMTLSETKPVAQYVYGFTSYDTDRWPEDWRLFYCPKQAHERASKEAIDRKFRTQRVARFEVQS